MKIKVEQFLMKKGNRVGKAAIEFGPEDNVLAGFHLVGFTICDDIDRGLFILFPSSMIKRDISSTEKNKTFFFLRPGNEENLNRLETAILDVYENMTSINHPVMK